MKTTHFLNARQFAGLNKVGDAMCPGNSDFPSFTQVGCAEHIDKVLEYAPEGDRNDLIMVLGLMSFLPVFLIRLLLHSLDIGSKMPFMIGAECRKAATGIRGLIMTLYYSGETGAEYKGGSPHDIIGFEVSVYLDDLKKT